MNHPKKKKKRKEKVLFLDAAKEYNIFRAW